MQRRVLSALIGTAMLLGLGAPAAADHNDYYYDIRVSGGRSDRGYQREPYRDLRSWFKYVDDWFHEYDDWFHSRSRNYRHYYRMDHDYGHQLHEEVFHRYGRRSSRAVSRQEDWLTRRYQRTRDWNWRRPGYTTNRRPRWDYDLGDDYYYSNDSVARRRYYGDSGYLSEPELHAIGTGDSIRHIVRGNRDGNDLETAAGVFSGVGNVLSLFNHYENEDDSYPYGYTR